jgi:vacuolar protein sorting-associated protein 52
MLPEKFLTAVINLNDRLTFLTTTTNPKTAEGEEVDLGCKPCDTQAGKDLIPEMMALKTRAILRIKEFFVNAITAMRKNKTNVNVIQQQSLLRYAKLYHFLNKEAPTTAQEVKTGYIEVMSKLVHTLFKNYYTALMKLEKVVTTKQDLLVIEEDSLKSIFSTKIVFSKDKNVKGSETFFIDTRDHVLERVETEPVLIHVAVAENHKFCFEALFRSVLKHLVDAASNEFLFLLDFFGKQTSDTFRLIFGKALSMLLENFENYLLNCYDVVSILLCIRITHSLRMVMQRRRIPIIDSFFDRISLMLWPRFRSVIELNINSLKSTCLETKKKSNNLLSPGQNSSSGIDLSPQYICRRYAELVCTIFILQQQQQHHGDGFGTSNVNARFTDSSLNQNTTNDNHTHSSVASRFLKDTSGDTDMDVAVAHANIGIGIGGGEHMITNSIVQLRTEMIALLNRMAHANIVSSKEQRVFFINQYDLILTVFEERKIDNDEVREFEDYLSSQKELFAEEEVKQAFPRLVSFVAQTEQLINSSEGAGAELDETIVESLVRDFASSWRTGITMINDDVLAYFSNFANGTEILKQVLTQLLLYYTRFQDIIKKSWTRAPAFTRDIVSTATIMMEIKKYSRTF